MHSSPNHFKNVFTCTQNLGGDFPSGHYACISSLISSLMVDGQPACMISNSFGDLVCMCTCGDLVCMCTCGDLVCMCTWWSCVHVYMQWSCVYVYMRAVCVHVVYNFFHVLSSLLSLVCQVYHLSSGRLLNDLSDLHVRPISALLFFRPMKLFLTAARDGTSTLAHAVHYGLLRRALYNQHALITHWYGQNWWELDIKCSK